MVEAEENAFYESVVYCRRRNGNFWRMRASLTHLVWRAHKLLPLALRSSAALALGLARQRAPVLTHEPEH